MTKSAKGAEIEDVLSSIRRLVATDRQALTVPAEGPGSGGKETGEAAGHGQVLPDPAADLAAEQARWDVDATEDACAPRMSVPEPAAEADTDVEGAAVRSALPSDMADLADPPPTFRRSAIRAPDPDLLVLSHGARTFADLSGRAGPGLVGTAPLDPAGGGPSAVAQSSAEGSEPPGADGPDDEMPRPARHQGGNLPRAGFRFGAAAPTLTRGAAVEAGVAAEFRLTQPNPAGPPAAEPTLAEPSAEGVLVLRQAPSPSAAAAAAAGHDRGIGTERVVPVAQALQSVLPGGATAGVTAGQAHPGGSGLGGGLVPTEGAAIGLDQEALAAQVASVIERELKGVLGQRITREIRRLVRQEIALALAARRSSEGDR